jgi:hypothetical protein
MHDLATDVSSVANTGTGIICHLRVPGSHQERLVRGKSLWEDGNDVILDRTTVLILPSNVIINVTTAVYKVVNVQGLPLTIRISLQFQHQGQLQFWQKVITNSSASFSRQKTEVSKICSYWSPKRSFYTI